MTQPGLIDITGIDKGELLAALYNAASPVGLGFLHADNKVMTAEEARKLLKSHTYFDYLKGRPLKVDLGFDELCPWMYDRNWGCGAAAHIVDKLRGEQ